MKPHQDFPFAELKSESGHSIKLLCYGYEYPREKSGSDADWLLFDINVIIPSFKCNFDRAFITGCSIESLFDELIKMSKSTKQQVAFHPLEPWIVLDFSLHKTGRVCVNGHTEDLSGPCSTLTFKFETDLTYIEKFICGLKDIIEVYPSRL